LTDGSLPADVKRTSALRRVPALEAIRFGLEYGLEGDVCAFELPRGAFPITVESPTGRMMAIAPGDAFLATPAIVSRNGGLLAAFPLVGSFRAATTGCLPIPEWSVN